MESSGWGTLVAELHFPRGLLCGCTTMQIDFLKKNTFKNYKRGLIVKL